MEYTFTSPALVFPAISLLMLAYTQRFLTLSDLVRSLHSRYLKSEMTDHKAKLQIRNLKKRLKIIRNMQIFGAGSFFLATMAMISYPASKTISLYFFITSLIVLLISLMLLIYELQISVNALNVILNEID